MSVSLALHLVVGMCLRHTDHRGLPSRYGYPIQIVATGEKEVVGREFVARGYWDDPTIFTRKHFNGSFETIVCPLESFNKKKASSK